VSHSVGTVSSCVVVSGNRVFLCHIQWVLRAFVLYSGHRELLPGPDMKLMTYRDNPPRDVAGSVVLCGGRGLSVGSI
jgi:hypothetical protein